MGAYNIPITPSPGEPASGGSSWQGIGIMGWRPGPGLNPQKGDADPNNEPPKGNPYLQGGKRSAVL
ncbi:MAG: hypothetical protein RQ885_00865 [Desulfurococcales archaeon]|nr:hypothetical protein [Desulfurococcales archaeon]